MARLPSELADLFDELTTSFWEGTVFEHIESVTLAGPASRRVAPCWFRRYMGDVCPECDGPIQGCHFIKRQSVESVLRDLLLPPEMVYRFAPLELTNWIGELVMLAAWDPRNGIPGCELHHAAFDGGRLAVPLRLVERAAPEVIEFSVDYGLESLLELRCAA
jgi:hypothetical protein